MEAEKRKLSAEIRHKRELLAQAVQLSGNLQNEAVQRLSREIDTLIVRYLRYQSSDKYPQALGAILLFPLLLVTAGGSGHGVYSPRGLNLSHEIHQSWRAGRRLRNRGQFQVPFASG